jgi:hypothetical protein
MRRTGHEQANASSSVSYGPASPQRATGKVGGADGQGSICECKSTRTRTCTRNPSRTRRCSRKSTCTTTIVQNQSPPRSAKPERPQHPEHPKTGEPQNRRTGEPRPSKLQTAGSRRPRPTVSPPAVAGPRATVVQPSWITEEPPIRGTRGSTRRSLEPKTPGIAEARGKPWSRRCYEKSSSISIPSCSSASRMTR